MNTTIERTAEAGLAAATCSPIPVRIDERLLHRIGVREWGMPSICMPGKCGKCGSENLKDTGSFMVEIHQCQDCGELYCEDSGGVAWDV